MLSYNTLVNPSYQTFAMKKKNIVAEVHVSDKLVKFVFNQYRDKDTYTEYYFDGKLIAKVPNNQIVVFSDYQDETQAHKG